MTILDRVYASGGDVIISTIELTCPAWAGPVLICNGFEDQEVTDENSIVKTFIAAGIDVALPKKNTQGAQTLTFAIDNITGEAQQKIDQALEAEQRISLIFRTYLASDLSAPADNPLRMTVMTGEIRGTSVQINCGFFNLIDTGWPRRLYTTLQFPGIKYL